MGRLGNWFSGENKNTPHSRNLKTSRILYAFAWLIEAFAVATGLVIAYMVGWSTYNENLAIASSGEAVTSFANVIIASLPFVLVAVVELAKIPTASAVYATKNIIWKTIFAVVLIFLAVITFETALNGFERNFNNLNFQVNKVRENLDVEKVQIARLEDAIKAADTLTRDKINNDFERQNLLFAENRDTSLEAIRVEESEIKTLANNGKAVVLQEQISELKETRKSLLGRRDKEIADASLTLDKSRDNQLADLDKQREVLSKQAESVQTRITAILKEREQEFQNKSDKLREPVNRIEDDIANLETEKRQKVEDSFFNKTSIEKRYNERISAKERELRTARSKLNGFSLEDTVANKELTEARKKLDTLNARISSFSSSSITATEVTNKTEALNAIDLKYSARLDANQREISSLNDQLSKVAGISENDARIQRDIVNKKREEALRKYSDNFNQISALKDQQLALLKEKETKILQYREEIEDRLNTVSELKSDINQKASNNQVFRIAMMFDPDADTAADVSKNAVDMVGKIWFGSLALVIAITGITLALASEVIADERQTRVSEENAPKRKSKMRAIALSVNRLARSRPKYKIKEVIKEVPVDKVAFRDVVKEVVKKEVVHVPIYTNDKKLLNNND